MLNPRTWRRYPLALLLALMAWLIPIASIITPATLSIHTAKVLPAMVSSHRVPNVDFRNTNFLATMGATIGEEASGYGPKPFYTYNGPSRAVMEVTGAVMAQRLILPISPPGLNTSWHSDFPGPALRCTKFTAAKIALIQDNIREYIKKCKSTQYGYLAWWPTRDTYYRHTDDMPFRAQSPNSSVTFHVGDPYALFTSDRVGGPLPLSLAILPKVFESYQARGSCPNNSRADAIAQIGDNMLQCQVYHSMYSVSFKYVEGVQNVNIVVANNQSDVPITITQSITGTLSSYPGYCPLDNPPHCFDDFRNLTYQAIWDAFTKNIVGSISSNVNSVLVEEVSSVDFGSKILDTALGQTSDLAFFAPALQTVSSLQGALSSAPGLPPWLQGLVTDASETSQLSLGDAMEEMFQNLTVSFMSSAALQPNYTSLTAPLPANVTFHRYHNVYAYSTWKLWIAYGIAILLTTITVFVGLIAILLNGASYSNNFSTIFRVARGAQLSPVEIHDEDLDGKDPLPNYLSKAKVFLNRHKGGDNIAYKRITPADNPVNAKGPTMTLEALNLQLPLRSNSRVTL